MSNAFKQVPKPVRNNAKLEYYEAKTELQKKGLEVPSDLLVTICNKWIIQETLKEEAKQAAKDKEEALKLISKFYKNND